MNHAPRIIAIDGPAASGKSSTGQAVARAFGLTHLDSGALYRAATWIAPSPALDVADVARLLEDAPISFELVDGTFEVRWDGRAIEAEIRSPEVTAQVSRVSAIPLVREWVNVWLRATVRQAGGAVVDGRDIGTVVFPEAPLKIFLTASPAARAARRLLQRDGVIDPVRLIAETAALAERDRLDAGRAVAPLRAADDAVRVDTTDLSFREQVACIVALGRERGLA